MIEGRVVAITGASRGIGAAAARQFAAEGARVALLARNGAQIAELADGIGEGLALALPCDVADAGQMRAALHRVADHFGGLDVLVNNAGVIDPIARIADADPAEWDRAIDINLKGVFYGMQAAIPLMRARGGGTIITVSSGAAQRPLEGWSTYCAAKAGAAMLTRAAHLEEAANGLRIFGLSPGTVATDMQVRIRASGINPVSQLDPSEHIPPDWPARALVWLCGPGAEDRRGEEISLRDPEVRRAVGLIA